MTSTSGGGVGPDPSSKAREKQQNWLLIGDGRTHLLLTSVTRPLTTHPFPDGATDY